jgi:hypothetical protein
MSEVRSQKSDGSAEGRLLFPLCDAEGVNMARFLPFRHDESLADRISDF